MIGRALLIWSSTIIVAVNVPSMVGFMKGDGVPEQTAEAQATLASTSVALVSTASEKRIPGRSWMRFTVLSFSDDQRNCHAPPARGGS